VALTEFALIDRYFRSCGATRGDVRLGVGDDAALLAPAAGQELVAATDTLVAGVHYPEPADPASLGHRALAVNLSDLAAMGARPAWALLALTLPRAEPAWLAEFAAGLRTKRSREATLADARTSLCGFSSRFSLGAAQDFSSLWLKLQSV